MGKDTITILERIHAAYYQFTAAERKVADFVLAQHDQVQFMSISQLAEECGTAEATISRFCRTLELKGFNAFKIELARDHVAVELLEKAPRVICIGSGGSMIIASECAHLFSTVTGKFFAVSDSHSQMSAVATLGKNDVIILFSYSGATTNGIQVLELAKQLGIPTILVTRFSKSPAAKLADVVLRCGSNESPFQFGSVPAKVAQLVVIDILFQEYCYRNRDACEQNIQRIASALSVKHI